jgi:hypothetical protein
MPSVSQQQQKLFGLALSVKRGETPESEASDDVMNIVNTMSEKDIEKYAKTKHDGLPKKAKGEGKLRDTIREQIQSILSESKKRKIIVYNTTTGESYEVATFWAEGDAYIALKALKAAAPKNMEYSIK